MQSTAQGSINFTSPDRLQRLMASLVTTNLTPTNSNLSFPIGANEVWCVVVQLTAQCSASGGMKYAVGAPTGATVEGWVFSSGAAITTPVYQRLTTINTLTPVAMHTAVAIPTPDVIVFTIMNGATAGTITLQAASVTAGQTTTIFAGSYMLARKVTNV